MSFIQRHPDSAQPSGTEQRRGETSGRSSGRSSGQRRAGDLRTPRHAGLIEAIRRLDATMDQAARDQLASWIREQYTSLIGDSPSGFFAHCYLGSPYVDHRLDAMGAIVEHYTPSDTVPEPFAAARGLARSEAYAYIEVWAGGTLIPVRPTGLPVAGPEAW